METMKATTYYSSIFSITTTTTTNPNPNKHQNNNYNNKPLSLSLYKTLKCIQSPIPPPKDSKPTTACSALTFTPSHTFHNHHNVLRSKLDHLADEFTRLTLPTDRLTRLLHYSSTALHPFPDSSRVDSNRVMGCTARVWVDVRLDDTGLKVVLRADSDSELMRGLCACLVWLLDGASPEEVLNVKAEDLMALSCAVGGVSGKERSRANTWHNVLLAMQKRTKRLVGQREGKAVAFDPFPSLVSPKTGFGPMAAMLKLRYSFPIQECVVSDELIRFSNVEMQYTTNKSVLVLKPVTLLD